MCPVWSARRIWIERPSGEISVHPTWPCDRPSVTAGGPFVPTWPSSIVFSRSPFAAPAGLGQLTPPDGAIFPVEYFVDTCCPSTHWCLAFLALVLCVRVQVEGSYVLTSGDLASSAMVRRLVTNMMNSTLRKLEVGAMSATSVFFQTMCGCLLQPPPAHAFFYACASRKQGSLMVSLPSWRTRDPWWCVLKLNRAFFLLYRNVFVVRATPKKVVEKSRRSLFAHGKVCVAVAFFRFLCFFVFFAASGHIPAHPVPAFRAAYPSSKHVGSV